MTVPKSVTRSRIFKTPDFTELNRSYPVDRVYAGTHERFADPYTREDFPQEIVWVCERMQWGEKKRPGRSGWVVYLDSKRITSFYEAKNWDGKHIPELKRPVATHLGN